MLKSGRVTKVKVFFLVLVFVFNFDLFKFSAAILKKGLLNTKFIFDMSAFFLQWRRRFTIEQYFLGVIVQFLIECGK